MMQVSLHCSIHYLSFTCGREREREREREKEKREGEGERERERERDRRWPIET